ncbi:MAG: hypothetical protein BWY83_01966 [bacterium ADurb.Bin478]|nr:MAG: hypothetical protein BWY83_01966 [bacterium ADurb.Bin478]
MKNYLSLLLVILFFAAGCSTKNPLEANAEKLVVRGYLYAHEPVQDIQLTSTLPLGSEATAAPPVNDASVSLWKNGVQYRLTPSAGDSGYYHYSGSDLNVESGDCFKLQVDYEGEVTIAETVVPNPPESLKISASHLLIPATFSPGIPGNFDQTKDDSTRSLTVTWKENLSSLFYVVLENMEANPTAISTNFPGFGDWAGFGLRAMVMPPSSANEYHIARNSVSYYGHYAVLVYRVNQEYADLYMSRTQDSRDLNEPLTNIQNGLGVFSAFCSARIEFEVVEE